MRFFYGLVFVGLLTSIALARAGEPRPVSCEVGIVGGGPAGVYLAYRLAERYGKEICVIEKNPHLGGRMFDEEIPHVGGSGWIGTGARRVNINQKLVLELGRELGIEFQEPERRTQLIYDRGHFGFSPDHFVPDYPGLIGPLDSDASTTREDEIYNLLIKHRSEARQFPDFKSYVAKIAGAPAVDFLRGVSRFHADFDYSLSPYNHLEYLAAENQTSSINVYPVGGMNEFVKRMEAKIRAKGVRIFVREPVARVDEAPASERGYRVTTSARTFHVQRLVLAIPPSGLNFVKGVPVDKVKSHDAYKAMLPIPIVVINQVWDQRWWEAARSRIGNTREDAIWRAWSSDGCVNHVEIPQESYLKPYNATRSVYTDDRACVAYWSALHQKEGIAGVEREVVKGLNKLFKFDPRNAVTIPAPVKTTFHQWPAGWYFVRSGTRLSNAEIAKWSIDPLSGQKDFMLVGEAYWLDRPGWSEGAYLSADALLKARFGVNRL